ncbi:pilin [Stigmatella aurantiaca]|uniref:Fimbrial protein n=1 Tax=Stigmatella aurantiaca (strain DW4/3-1) TaxID=378806 RepID=Q08ZY0_STIAD|nr:pilin [Stigmatella aurantiaca]ADO71220.1 Putative fimbrial protein [Stigmatella aurantiaca DW4/3-1]EAU66027.1 pilin [Stigmatella aurantiaca DW4/3-1]
MTPTSAAPETPKKSALPGVALGFAIVSLCLGCLWPVGLVLSILAMMKTGQPEYAGGRGRALAALIVSVVGFFFLGLQAAVVIPNFLKFQVRAKQAECKLNLSSLKLAASMRMLEDQPVNSFQELDFDPGPGNRYAYVLRLPDAILPVGASFPSLDPARIQAALRDAGVEPGVKGECPDCTLTFACVGNVDLDDTLDVWSITTGDRTDDSDTGAERGQPIHHVNDAE